MNPAIEAFNRLFTAGNLFDMFEQHEEGILVIGADARIIYINPVQCRLEQVDPSQVIGKNVLDIYKVGRANSPTIRCIESKQVVKTTLVYKTQFGKRIYAIHDVYPLFKNGELAGVVCFIRDMHQSKRILYTQSPPQLGTQRKTLFQFKDIVGLDPMFTSKIKLAKKAARSHAPVMISGETGSGKEVFVQAIHTAREEWGDKQPYVPINCAAIPEPLLESILFGTSKGAFTGAVEKPGLFEKANKGTLFLDEINSMPLGLQAKLLRVIQEKKVRRVGSLEEIPVESHLISALNEAPKAALQAGRLRSDLFYRLGVINIDIPPLRGREHDLMLLCHYFLQQKSTAYKRENLYIAPESYHFLLKYPWPGNVRELEHAIESAVALLPVHEISLRPCHLPSSLLDEPSIGGMPIQAPCTLNPSPASLRKPQYSDPHSLQFESRINLKAELSRIEAAYIQKALDLTGDNATQAGKILNLSPQMMHYKKKNLSVSLE